MPMEVAEQVTQRHGQERAVSSYDSYGAQTPVMSGRPAIQRLQNETDIRFGQQSLHRVQKGGYGPQVVEGDNMSPGYGCETDRG